VSGPLKAPLLVQAAVSDYSDSPAASRASWLSRYSWIRAIFMDASPAIGIAGESSWAGLLRACECRGYPDRL
jgi:hypothetical protein